MSRYILLLFSPILMPALFVSTGQIAGRETKTEEKKGSQFVLKNLAGLQRSCKSQCTEYSWKDSLSLLKSVWH